jgi:hypothetical protein
VALAGSGVMNDHNKLELAFGADVEEKTRRRIDYAFRVFCAIHGFCIAPPGAGVRLYYGRGPAPVGVHPLSAGYRWREPSEPTVPPRLVPLPGDLPPGLDPPGEFPLFHPAGEDGRPDWLGEIFEWLSGAHEHSVRERDGVGRVAYSRTLHGRFHLDPGVPYATLAMLLFNRVISGIRPGWPLKPRKPWRDGFSTAIAATHVLDFLPTSVGVSLRRLAKNVGIAALAHRDPRLVWSILRSAAGHLMHGRSAVDGVPDLVSRERREGINSTFTVICRNGHRRDADYELSDPWVQGRLRSLAAAGHGIGVHGSYRSLEEQGGLAAEYSDLRALGFAAGGGRQHWLRYAGSRLFEELSEAEACYDCSVGYPQVPGFRQGASFPYPPYDFREEKPFSFLELPLVIMDTTLYNLDRRGTTWRTHCDRVLSRTRSYGWGGISILWHDTVFRGGQLPCGVADLYWQIRSEADRWMSAEEVVELVWPRFAEVGLLPECRP